METKPNASAFPFQDNGSTVVPELGLSKREYFSAMIMQGLASNSQNIENTTKADAIIAVNAADQLILALNAKEG